MVGGGPHDRFVNPVDTHMFLDPSSPYPYLCKKGISSSQAPRLNRICFDKKCFDKRCNDLERWLMERTNNEKNDKQKNINSSRIFQEKPL